MFWPLKLASDQFLPAPAAAAPCAATSAQTAAVNEVEKYMIVFEGRKRVVKTQKGNMGEEKKGKIWFLKIKWPVALYKCFFFFGRSTMPKWN